MKRSHIIIGAAVLLVFIFAYLQYGEYRKRKAAQLAQTVTVAAAPVIQKDVTVHLRTIGNVEAYNTVNVQSLVDGQVMQIGFKEGAMVKQGQLLFVIDPRPNQVQLQQALANLQRDKAQLWNNELILERNAKLMKKNYLSQSDFDQAKANLEAQAALVKSDEAAVANAQLQLSYSYINSPIAGRAGSYGVDVGNIVKTAAGTVLTTVNQVNPIYVSFSVPQQYYYMLQKQNEQKQLINVTVQAEKSGKAEIGQVTFFDNNVNTSTGTIQLKATFANNDLALWPGQYVDVELPTAKFSQALVVATDAVQMGQNGAYVYVIKSDSTVSFRPVVIGPKVEEGTVITKGLQKGEQVVTAGQLQLNDGTPVRVANDVANKISLEDE